MAHTPIAPGTFRINAYTGEYEVFDGKSWLEEPRQAAAQAAPPRPHVNAPAIDYTKESHTIKWPADHTIKWPGDDGNKFTVNSTWGRFTIDLETGELTMPAGVTKNEGLRQFWLAFQEHFKGPTNNEYEQQIVKLNNEVAYYKSKLATFNDNVRAVEKQKLIDKVRNKYGSDKFIMTKPDELIKLLESE